jgi:uncharacterized repeat protein (TIGR03803 family)
MKQLLDNMKRPANRRSFMSKLSWGKSACAVALLCVATAIASPAQTFTTLVNFNDTNGMNPYTMSLVQGTDGNLYGITEFGGANGVGTVFKVTPTGTLATLYSFCAKTNCTDGAVPFGGLVLGTDGNFYGTTSEGGETAEPCGAEGGIGDCGTVFKITPAGKLTTLHSFDSTDGYTPGYGPLVQAANGNFYGTTTSGGAYGWGAVFSVTSGGAFTLLHSFDYTDGSAPNALIQAANGNFYGTTAAGGTGAGGDGTVFSITSGGALTTLHSFGGTDGNGPFAALVQAGNGNFYGTTTEGGANNLCNEEIYPGCGEVFEITPAGKLTIVHSFDNSDGYYPVAPLIQATNGNLYGTITYGGAHGDGTVFEITPTGTLTTLYSFDYPGGVEPLGGLVQATNGTFYGTTTGGGANNDGTIFSLNLGLGPFVETLPTSGKVGAAVMILGTDLTGASSLTFDGTAAVFKVVSNSEITTTVPSGATTGEVEVVTPTGTLSSNVSFRVP